MALENARLYQDVQQADRQKNEFLSMMAHELRNPLAPLRNAAEVLRHQGTDPNRVRWAQGVIDRQLGHMVRLVDDLLDVSRLTLGKIRLAMEPVVLDAVVGQAVEATRQLFDQFGHDLQVTLPTLPIRLTGDKARLTQVLTNLLNNAAEYTDPGGRITVSAESGIRNTGLETEEDRDSASPERHSEMVEIRVRDTGVGIALELLPTVFDLFTQANRSLDRSQGGLGVGLTLVHRLVEMHGGSVEARSDGPGKGSQFVVRLPIAPEKPASAGPAENPGGPAPRPDRNGSASTVPRSPLKVVVVDDNVDGAESLASLLGMLGHQVRVAHDGPSGIVAVGGFDPDLVLLDIGLPGLDGYEVARRLRRDPACRAVLVAVSGYGRDEDRRNAREAGFAHHFVKPMEFDTFRALLESVRTVRPA
jgi:two-component system CheB/CheR fusion protein